MKTSQWKTGDRICGSRVIDGVGEPEIAPEIPFSEFPPLPRTARPDADGALAWFVTSDA